MSVRDLDVAVLRDVVARLLPSSRRCAARSGASSRCSGAGRSSRSCNYEIAAVERLPVCQDSGLAVVMLETGQHVHWVGGVVQQAIYDGVREAPAPVTCDRRR